MVSKYTPLDTGYSWVVLASSTLMTLLLNSNIGGLGVLMVELMHHFNVPKSVIVWIGGILLSVGFILSFLIGWVIKKFGCRRVGCLAALASSISLILASYAKTVNHLYITYGFMLGTFTAAYFNISSVMVQQYFDKRRAFAQGTVMAGLSGGIFIWPPLTRYFIDVYGWRGALFLHGGIQLHGIVLSALMRPPHRPVDDKRSEGNTNGNKNLNTSQEGNFTEETQIQPDMNDANHELPNMYERQKVEGCGNLSKCFRALFKVTILFPHFILYILAVVCVQSGSVLLYSLTPVRADALNIDRRLGALLPSISAGISGICRVIFGIVGDLPWVNRLVICGLSGVLGGALTAVSVVPNTFLGLAIICAFISIPSSSYMATFSSAAVDIVGLKYVQQGIGLMIVGFGLAQLTTFLVTGWISDVLGDTKYGFLIFGSVEIMGGFIFLATYWADKRFKRLSHAPSPSTQHT